MIECRKHGLKEVRSRIARDGKTVTFYNVCQFCGMEYGHNVLDIVYARDGKVAEFRKRGATV